MKSTEETRRFFENFCYSVDREIDNTRIDIKKILKDGFFINHHCKLSITYKQWCGHAQVKQMNQSYVKFVFLELIAKEQYLQEDMRMAKVYIVM